MDFTLSPYLIAPLAAWIVAQGAKYTLIAAKHRSFDHVRQLYLSGNMPSAHSATVISLATVVLMKDGFESDVFALAALLAAIVMYDSVMVRRSVGEQGAAIHELIRLQPKVSIRLPRAAKGHEPLEVVAGALTGAIIGVVVFLTTK